MDLIFLGNPSPGQPGGGDRPRDSPCTTLELVPKGLIPVSTFQRQGRELNGYYGNSDPADRTNFKVEISIFAEDPNIAEFPCVSGFGRKRRSPMSGITYHTVLFDGCLFPLFSMKQTSRVPTT